MYNFTRDEIMAEYRKQFPNASCCTDMMDQARKQKTLQEAVDMLELDTAFWEGRLM